MLLDVRTRDVLAGAGHIGCYNFKCGSVAPVFLSEMMGLSSVISLLIACVIVDCCGKTLRIEPDFDEWALKNGKKYPSNEEYLKRRIIFHQNVKLVETHNSKHHTYNLGINKFADLTHEEFSNLYLLSTPQNCSATHTPKSKLPFPEGLPLPGAIDWRKKGVVSPVKNQGSCGSCWTFSTTGAMEAHMAIEFGGGYNLSEQQLVDCAQAFNNHGCSGGLPSQAFEYIHYNPGLMREEDYPYTAKDGKCRFQEDKAVAFVKEVHNITQYDEHGLQVAVAYAGPVSIAFQVASDFRLYKSGVYKSKVCLSDPQHVNHAVLVVGYDTTDQGEPYWIVKNSWGTDFGIDGYFNIYRGSNMCGLSDCASYPITTKKPGKDRS